MFDGERKGRRTQFWHEGFQLCNLCPSGTFVLADRQADAWRPERQGRMQEPELEPAAAKLDAGSATATSEPFDAAAAPIAEPPDLHKHPILEQWEYNSDGSIAGRVYGKKGFKEGEQMTTSIVPEKTRYATYVITGSGSI